MLTLYTVPTANGQRASIALEECDIRYDVRHVDLLAGEHRSAEMLALNPIGRMPVLAGEDDDGVPVNVYGSHAIGLYASETSGRLVPAVNERADFHTWLGILQGDLAPAFAAQFHLGVLAPERYQWGLDWYADIIRRILEATDAHLDGRAFFLDSGYTIVDVMMYPTAVTSAARLDKRLEPYPALAAWVERVAARPAVQRGMEVSGSF